MAESSCSMLHVEGMQSVMPRKVTDPRLSSKLSVSGSVDQEFLQKRVHVVLYYEKQSEEDSGWIIGGWIRESLGRALSEQPLLGGRLVRAEEDTGGFEIVANDSGVRLVEAQVPLSLTEFRKLREKEEMEAKLVNWTDVEEENPHFSPLFYVQVTNFCCGGYSVGISFNILLADPLFMATFLKRWANIHNDIRSDAGVSELPLFYLPNLKQIGHSPPLANVSSHSSRKASETMIFSVCTKGSSPEELDTISKFIVVLCIDEAECKLGAKMTSQFTLFVKTSLGETEVETVSRKEIDPQSYMCCDYELRPLSWVDVMRSTEMAFREGNRPIDVLHWVGVGGHDQGLVLAVISSTGQEDKSRLTVYVTYPIDK